MTRTTTTTTDILPAGTFQAGSWWIRQPKETTVVEHPKRGMEILPPEAFAPARLPAVVRPPAPVRDEIPEGTFHGSGPPPGGSR